MQIRLIALACTAACASSPIVAIAKPNACTITADSPNNLASRSQLVNKCAPDITFFIGGASVQQNAIKTLLTTNGAIFDTTKPYVKVRDVAQSVSGTGSESTAAVAGTDYNTIAYIGYGASSMASIKDKRVMVVYNKANGSFAGVNTLLTGKGGQDEETTLVTTTVKEQASIAGKAIACPQGKTASTASYDAIPTYDCVTEVAIKTGWGADKQKVLHMALSDMRPSEAVPGVVKSWKPSAFPAIGTGMQGFGIAVNAPLYAALIAREVAANRMASSCRSSETLTGATLVLTADCQPSLSPAEYSALLTGAISSANDLLGTTGDTKKIVLNRYAYASGTQAAAEAFFAGRAFYDVKAKVKGGYLRPLGGTVGNPIVILSSFGAAGVEVVTWSTTDEVIDAIRGDSANYALGVVSLSNGFDLNTANALRGTLWIKFDGISPNLYKDSSGATAVDKTAKVGFAQGYAFVYEVQAIRSAKLSGAHRDIFDKIVGSEGLAAPKASVDMNGFVAKSEAPFTRGDSNFHPLSKY
jgi:hypothetical protein